MFNYFVVPKEIKSSRTSGRRSEVSSETTLYKETRNKRGVQGYYAESST